MANLKFYKTGTSGKTLLWIILLVVLIHKALPMVPKSWNFMIMGFSRLWMLIKWRPFIYVIVNFIIISIFISSSSFTHKLNNLLLKIHRKSSHNISSLISQTSQKFIHSFDDETWWSRIVNDEKTENLTPLDESRVHGDKGEKTASFEVKGEESYEEKIDDYVTHVESNKLEEEEEEVDTLDATWKAIMEAKNKGSGPHLKKSGTWTAGDRCGGGGGGGGEEVAKVGKGRLARYKVELKKWSTFSRDIVQEKKDFGGGRCGGNGGDGGGGGGDGGWRGAEVALTYHDDLKKRADAFIARVTRDMRLQRMESDQPFLDTINRGSK